MPTSYEDLRSIKRLELLPILQFHMVELLKSIKRKISRRGKKRVVTSVTAAPPILIPYFVAIKRDMIHPVFTGLVPSSLGRSQRWYKSCHLSLSVCKTCSITFRSPCQLQQMCQSISRKAFPKEGGVLPAYRPRHRHC